ncbi:hypothetical protein PM082_015072 [Marasmius tenuissimus]|nr:hypothetical protein PM082_015072 [Marasmius tenuissimus]
MATTNIDIDMTSSSSLASSTATQLPSGSQQPLSKPPLSTYPSSSSTTTEMPASSYQLQTSPSNDQSHPPSPSPSNHSLSDADSESSFPSVSSSFFFSSAAHSPYSNPYSHPQSHDSGGEYGADQGGDDGALHMIIPSLTLPEPLPLNNRNREATVIEIKLVALVKSSEELESNFILEDAHWDEADEGMKVLRGTLALGGEDSDSDSSEHLERTVQRVVIWALEDSDSTHEILRQLVHSSFQSLDRRFHPELDSEDLTVSSLFLSEIYTLLLVCSPSKSLDGHDLEDLIPVVPSTSNSTLPDLMKPENLTKLRNDVANAFLQWRSHSHPETHDREATYVNSPPIPTIRQITPRAPTHTVVRRHGPFAVRKRTIHHQRSSPGNSPSPEESTVLSPRPRSPNTSSNGRPRKKPLSPPSALSKSLPLSAHPAPHNSVIVDPLHLPSLLMLGADLFGAMKERVFGRHIQEQKQESDSSKMSQIVQGKVSGRGGASPFKSLFLGFCVGLGAGMWLGRTIWGA